MSNLDALRSLLARVRRRWFAVVGLRTLGWTAGLASAPIVAALALDAVVSLEGLPLVITAAAVLLASIGLVGACLWRMQPRPGDRQVARFIEERAEGLPGVGRLDDELVSAVDAVADPGKASAGLRDLIVGRVLARLDAVHPSDIIDGHALRRAAGAAGAGTAILIATVLAALPGLERSLETARLMWFPQTIQIEVQPGDARVVAGQGLSIRAVVRAGGATLAGTPPALTVVAGDQRRSVPMQPSGDGFEFAFDSVDRSFAYHVTAGSARSGEYTVTALFPPRVRRIDVHYRYPAFAKLPDREEEDGGDIYAPAGTRVRIRVHTDKPIASADLAFGGGPALPLESTGERVVETELVLKTDDSYRVRLADLDGLASGGETEYFIRLMNDRPPTVRILRPAGDQQITPLEEVTIEARADDDYGVASFDLVYAVAGGKERIVPFGRRTGTDVSTTGSVLLAAEDLDVQPGDVITYYARARDIGRGKPSTEARSDLFFLEVKPFSAEFTSAQSQAMGGGGAAGAQIEALIAAQKEIISATWNVERRATAGRSADDIRSIAEAQAELKARAEQLSARSGGRGRFRPPVQQIPPRPVPLGQGQPDAADPVAEAVRAMDQALQQLRQQRTREAIPHEMAALQGLLRAQAEVRRRQVTQQRSASSGGGWGNRQTQDLSALFDRELQRQQRTNYETRTQIDERPENRTDDSALDRIRDLARRQEELAKRQAELARAGLSAEEMKRRLERLTREQSELRRQLEELARQMGQQQTSPSGQQQGRQAGEQSGQQSSDQRGSQSGQPQGERSQQGEGAALGRAAEDMQNAASGLRREDAEAAARSAARAAEQLRQLEQEMRGSSPEARRRAAGNLQLEAQQVAEAQRRVAAEADRLQGADPSAAADARRRLAGEKERLADRVDGLQQSAGELAREGGSGTEGLAEAARDLEKQQLGRRMRETARQVREGAGPGAAEAARAEQEMARALDRIAERLGAAGSDDAQRLSEQLGQSRDIRDRLDRLERQLREAETRERAAREEPAGPPSDRGQQGDRGQQAQRGQPGQQAGGAGSGEGEIERLREEYARELERAREMLGRLSGAGSREGLGGSTPEHHEYSQSAPGNEGFKQDFSGWESLRRDVDSALEAYESQVSERLAKTVPDERFHAGGSDRVPERYRRLIARYYEALAKGRR